MSRALSFAAACGVGVVVVLALLASSPAAAALAKGRRASTADELRDQAQLAYYAGKTGHECGFAGAPSDDRDVSPQTAALLRKQQEFVDAWCQLGDIDSKSVGKPRKRVVHLPKSLANADDERSDVADLYHLGHKTCKISCDHVYAVREVFARDAAYPVLHLLLLDADGREVFDVGCLEAVGEEYYSDITDVLDLAIHPVTGEIYLIGTAASDRLLYVVDPCTARFQSLGVVTSKFVSFSRDGTLYGVDESGSLLRFAALEPPTEQTLNAATETLACPSMDTLRGFALDVADGITFLCEHFVGTATLKHDKQQNTHYERTSLTVPHVVERPRGFAFDKRNRALTQSTPNLGVWMQVAYGIGGTFFEIDASKADARQLDTQTRSAALAFDARRFGCERNYEPPKHVVTRLDKPDDFKHKRFLAYCQGCAGEYRTVDAGVEVATDDDDKLSLKDAVVLKKLQQELQDQFDLGASQCTGY